MKIILMCSANRGVRAARALVDMLKPEDELALFTFKEAPWEPSFVDELRAIAQEHSLHLRVTSNAGKLEHHNFISGFQPDLLLLIGWRYLVSEKTYSIPRIGTFVFHDSLLPAYRGFAPTVWAMINGENETGVSLFKISERMDEGDLIGQKVVPIPYSSDIAQVTDSVTEAYLDVLNDVIPKFRSDEIEFSPQDHSKATYTCKRTPEDGEIDWSLSANTVYNLIRASAHPYPGAFTSLGGAVLHIWSAEVIYPERRYVGLVPGRVIEIRQGSGVVIATGDGCVLVKKVSMGNDKKTSADALITSISTSLGN